MRQRIAARFADYFYGHLYWLEQILFDLYMGTSAARPEMTAGDIFSIGGDNMPYEGCMWPALERALAELEPAASDVFVDLGSGKGKGLLVAGRLHYGRVMGVELDAGLAERARRNVSRARRKLKANSVDIDVANVMEWKIPDDVSVVFMCNPFIGETFHAAVSAIFDSYDRNPRRLHIVYEHPWEHNWMVGTGRLVVENVRSSTWPNRKRWWESNDVITTYHVTPQGTTYEEAACVPRGRTHGEAMKRWSVANGHKFGFNVQTLAAGGLGEDKLAELKRQSG
jgi:hypothetical protein